MNMSNRMGRASLALGLKRLSPIFVSLCSSEGESSSIRHHSDTFPLSEGGFQRTGIIGVFMF